MKKSALFCFAVVTATIAHAQSDSKYSLLTKTEPEQPVQVSPPAPISYDNEIADLREKMDKYERERTRDENSRLKLEQQQRFDEQQRLIQQQQEANNKGIMAAAIYGASIGATNAVKQAAPQPRHCVSNVSGQTVFTNCN